MKQQDETNITEVNKNYLHALFKKQVNNKHKTYKQPAQFKWLKY